MQRALVPCVGPHTAALPMVAAAASPPLPSLRRTCVGAGVTVVPYATSRSSWRTPQHTSYRGVHIDHSTDIHKWRNAEKEEVRRQFRGGVKLGSEFVKFREQEQVEKQLIEEDKFTNWRLVYAYSLGVVLLLGALNMMMIFVKPNPSPEYVPYEDPSASTTKATNNAPSSSAEH